MAEPKDIIKIFTPRQLSRYKIDRDAQIDDLAVIRVKDEPSVYNNYSSAIHSYLILLKNIVKKDREDNDVYTFDVYFEDGSIRHNFSLDRWQLLSIAPITITDEVYTKVKNKYDRKIAKEKKLAEERAEQRRRDEEQMRIFEEERRKQEEEIRLARKQEEEERKAAPMLITVGMWEDIMERLSDLESTVSDMDMTINTLQHHFDYE